MKGFHQAIRGVSAALATQTDFKLVDFHAKWKPFAPDKSRPADDGQVKRQVVVVHKELPNFGPLLA